METANSETVMASHPPPLNYNSASLPQESSIDLYTIPSHSCWFSWDSIHDTERAELREFFDGSSFTRSPKIYKEYRDFIISKYREDPSRRLTFTDVRKSLVGDVCVLRKVFDFLDKWGLINFSASPTPAPENEGPRVRVEEGTPVGIRVVATPNSSKPLSVMGSVGGGGGGCRGGGVVDIDFKLPPLASYSDVFEEVGRKKEEISCGNCQEKCELKYYECTKEKYVVCLGCFEKGIYGENRSKDDFKLNDSVKSSGTQGSVWTEAETLLLLESVLKHGDDWELVAKNVQTKTKLECISRLIELPFGELMLGSHGKVSIRGIIEEANSIQEPIASSEPQETKKVENDMQQKDQEPDWWQENDRQQENDRLQDDDRQQGNDLLQENDRQHENDLLQENDRQQDNDRLPENDRHQENGRLQENDRPQENDQLQENDRQQENDQQQEIVEGGKSFEIERVELPTKKRRIEFSDPSRSLIEQVALISAMVGPQITATAASAAVTVLSDGNPLVREIFYSEDDLSECEHRSGNLNNELERALQSEDTEMKDASHSPEMNKLSAVRDSIPLALRMRAAVATALGAAAARARLLADQEEREIEHLMAFIIETQLKKLERKAKYLEHLEHLMEKEHALLEESKDSTVGERIEILDKIFASGISRGKMH